MCSMAPSKLVFHFQMMLPRNNCSNEGLAGLSVLWGDLWKFAFSMVTSRTEVADVVYDAPAGCPVPCISRFSF